MPESVGGIPIHPLVVHAVVVLIPLSALGVMVLTLVPRWARQYGTLVAVAAFVAVGAIPVATQSGETLKAALPQRPEIDHHAAIGHDMLFLGPPLFIAAVAMWWVGRCDARGRPLGRGLQVTVRVLSFLAAAAALGWVLRVGHSGAETVWKGVGTPPVG